MKVDSLFFVVKNEEMIDGISQLPRSRRDKGGGTSG